MREVRDVVKTYGTGNARVEALRGVTLSIRGSEVGLLMGPSGSGKTTLLSVMGCILRPTSGSLRVNGAETTGLSEGELPQVRLRHFGFVFQSFNLFPALTARENVELALQLRNIRGSLASRRVRELLADLGLAAKMNRRPEDLSGGEKQRVAIARAIAADVRIVLADEPTAALDSDSGKHVMEILHSLAHTSGKAVVVVTHDSRLLHYGDRVIRIEDGLIEGGA